MREYFNIWLIGVLGLRFQTAAAVAALALGCLADSAGLAQDGRFGAILLKETNRVILGNIRQKGDFCEVEIAKDSKVSIPLAKIAHVGESVEELYEFKCRSIARWLAGDHFQLTHWCLLNDLLEQAAKHYSEVASQAPGHPRVKQLAVELEKRLLQEPEFRDYLGIAPQTPASTALAAAASKPLQASANVVAASAQSLAAAKHPEIARQFKERVQPILLNRCSQAACHGVQSSNQLRLLQPYAQAHARLTSENMSSVLLQVASNSNENSPLMLYATRAHGIQTSPAIAVTETHLVKELLDWIAFTQNPVVAAVATGQTPMREQVRAADQRLFMPFQPAVTLIPVELGSSGLLQVPRDARPMPNTANPNGLPTGDLLPSAEEIDALDAELKKLLGEPASNGQITGSSSDPFDPAEFNRKSLQNLR